MALSEQLRAWAESASRHGSATVSGQTLGLWAAEAEALERRCAELADTELEADGHPWANISEVTCGLTPEQAAEARRLLEEPAAGTVYVLQPRSCVDKDGNLIRL